MADILLLHPPVSFTNPLANSRDHTFPIGMSYLAASLERAGISFRAIDNSSGVLSLKDILDICEKEHVRILGLSAVTPTIRSSIQIARAVKDRWGDKITVLLGNAHVSVDPDVLKRYPYFDTAIQGEADEAIVKYVTRTLQGERLRGIIPPEIPRDLDMLPFPAFDRVEHVDFLKRSLVSILGTRGCPYACGYCARPALAKIVRGRSADNIVDEMIARRPLTRSFFFNDDAATIQRDRVLFLSETLLKRKAGVRFEMTTRLDLLDDEMAKALKRAGCTTLIVGIESGNERVRQEVIQKNLSDAKIFRGIEIAARAGLPVQLLFMLGHPDETPQEVRDTIEFPLKLIRMGFNNIEVVGYHLTVPFPGTRYFQWGVEKELIPKGIIDEYIEGRLGDGFYGHWPYLVPPGATMQDMIRWRSEAIRRFYLRPGYVMGRLVQDLKRPAQLWSDAKNAFFVMTKGASSDMSKLEV